MAGVKKDGIFNIAGPKEIIAGRVTDVYFERTLAALEARGLDPLVKMEIIAKGFPHAWPWGILAGLDEALGLLGGIKVRVRAMAEGSVIYPWEPVLEVEGRYKDFCKYETALLGLLCQASGVATKAARFKLLAGERQVISFGARRMHPALAPMIERNAYLGGCDGVSVGLSGELIGQDPMGTMPHALVLCFGSTVEALKALDEVLKPKARRVALVDTFLDEKFESINAARALGKRLYALRFDTPGSRRGDFLKILQECRWELDLRGFGHVKFYVSGGIREEDVPVLNPLVAGYGIGTQISNAQVLDFSMDIVELDGEPTSKRGKRSGSKRVLGCSTCGARKTLPAGKSRVRCVCGKPMKDLLGPVLKDGKFLIKPEPVGKVRKRVLKSLRGLELH